MPRRRQSGVRFDRNHGPRDSNVVEIAYFARGSDADSRRMKVPPSQAGKGHDGEQKENLPIARQSKSIVPGLFGDWPRYRPASGKDSADDAFREPSKKTVQRRPTLDREALLDYFGLNTEVNRKEKRRANGDLPGKKAVKKHRKDAEIALKTSTQFSASGGVKSDKKLKSKERDRKVSAGDGATTERVKSGDTQKGDEPRKIGPEQQGSEEPILKKKKENRPKEKASEEPIRNKEEDAKPKKQESKERVVKYKEDQPREKESTYPTLQKKSQAKGSDSKQPVVQHEADKSKAQESERIIKRKEQKPPASSVVPGSIDAVEDGGKLQRALEKEPHRLGKGEKKDRTGRKPSSSEQSSDVRKKGSAAGEEGSYHSSVRRLKTDESERFEALLGRSSGFIKKIEEGVALRAVTTLEKVKRKNSEEGRPAEKKQKVEKRVSFSDDLPRKSNDWKQAEVKKAKKSRPVSSLKERKLEKMLREKKKKDREEQLEMELQKEKNKMWIKFCREKEQREVFLRKKARRISAMMSKEKQRLQMEENKKKHANMPSPAKHIPCHKVEDKTRSLLPVGRPHPSIMRPRWALSALKDVQFRPFFSIYPATGPGDRGWLEDLLRNLTVKVTKTCVQNKLVPTPLVFSQAPPRFKNRVPFSQFALPSEIKKISNRDLHGEIDASEELMHRYKKGNARGYDREMADMQCFDDNCDAVCCVKNAVSLYLFSPDSPFGDTSNRKSDFMNRRVTSPQKMKFPKTFVRYLMETLKFRGDQNPAVRLDRMFPAYIPRKRRRQRTQAPPPMPVPFLPPYGAPGPAQRFPPMPRAIPGPSFFYPPGAVPRFPPGGFQSPQIIRRQAPLQPPPVRPTPSGGFHGTIW